MLAASPYNGHHNVCDNDNVFIHELYDSQSVGCNFLEGWYGEPTFCTLFASIDCLTYHQ